MELSAIISNSVDRASLKLLAEITAPNATIKFCTPDDLDSDSDVYLFEIREGHPEDILFFKELESIISTDKIILLCSRESTSILHPIGRSLAATGYNVLGDGLKLPLSLDDNLKLFVNIHNEITYRKQPDHNREFVLSNIELHFQPSLSVKGDQVASVNTYTWLRVNDERISPAQYLSVITSREDKLKLSLAILAELENFLCMHESIPEDLRFTLLVFDSVIIEPKIIKAIKYSAINIGKRLNINIINDRASKMPEVMIQRSANLYQLISLGVQVTLPINFDVFGEYLPLTTPFHNYKISPSVTAKAANTTTVQALLTYIISMALETKRSIEMSGIETDAVLNTIKKLKGCGVDISLSGYKIAPPMIGQEFVQWIEEFQTN